MCGNIVEKSAVSVDKRRSIDVVAVLVKPDEKISLEDAKVAATALVGSTEITDRVFEVLETLSSRVLSVPESLIGDDISCKGINSWELEGLNYKSCWYSVELIIRVAVTSDSFEELDDEKLISLFRESRRKELLALNNHINVNFCIVGNNSLSHRHKSPKLAVFDMDSTLIQQEVIDELAAEAGPEVCKSVAETTERAMQGLLDFKESLRERVFALKGVPANDIVSKVRKRIIPTRGSVCLLRVLRALESRTAVVSGGFIPFGRYVQHLLGLDFAFANQLEITKGDNGKILSGYTIGPVVDAGRKKELLLKLCESDTSKLVHGVDNNINKLMAAGYFESNDEDKDIEYIAEPKTNVISCGDGANDLEMMTTASISIAFCAKQKVMENATCWITFKRMDCYLFFLGLTSTEIDDLFVKGSKLYAHWAETNKYLLDMY